MDIDQKVKRDYIIDEYFEDVMIFAKSYIEYYWFNIYREIHNHLFSINRTFFHSDTSWAVRTTFFKLIG